MKGEAAEKGVLCVLQSHGTLYNIMLILRA